MIDPARAALILIDMQMGFIDASSSLCIAGAAASVPACERALAAARERGMAVFHLRREYAADGSDVEAVRYERWMKGGRPLSAARPASLACPPGLEPREGEPVIFKPSFSAFLGTDLHERLVREGIGAIVLAGTTTPNCVRSTCYDGLSLGYNVVVVKDATSSRSPEVQAANLEDMAAIGAQLISSETLSARGLTYLRDIEGDVRIARSRFRADDDAERPAIEASRALGALSDRPLLVDIETVSTGWINKYRLRYTMPNGRPYTYESVSRKGPEAYAAALARLEAGEAPVPDAVCIVPVLADESVLLIREFRYPLNSWCISFPAGLIEPGEDLAAAVDRELSEETGYRLRTDLEDEALVALPQPGFSSTGLAEENVQVVFAQVEPAGEATPDAAELIECFTVAADDIRSFLDENDTPIGTRCQLVLEMLASL